MNQSMLIKKGSMNIGKGDMIVVKKNMKEECID